MPIFFKQNVNGVQSDNKHVVKNCIMMYAERYGNNKLRLRHPSPPNLLAQRLLQRGASTGKITIIYSSYYNTSDNDTIIRTTYNAYFDNSSIFNTHADYPNGISSEVYVSFDDETYKNVIEYLYADTNIRAIDTQLTFYGDDKKDVRFQNTPLKGLFMQRISNRRFQANREIFEQVLKLKNKVTKIFPFEIGPFTEDSSTYYLLNGGQSTLDNYNYESGLLSPMKAEELQVVAGRRIYATVICNTVGLNDINYRKEIIIYYWDGRIVNLKAVKGVGGFGEYNKHEVAALSFIADIAPPGNGKGYVLFYTRNNRYELIATSIGSQLKDAPCAPDNAPLIVWRNRYGGINSWIFRQFEESFVYSGGKKARRIKVMEDGLTENQWRGLQDLNTTGEEYNAVKDSAKRRTQADVCIDIGTTEPKLIDVIVIPTTTRRSNDTIKHYFETTIELPDEL